MTLTSKAQRIMERGLGAFRSMRTRPDSGHTNLVTHGGGGRGPVLQFTCVVGAIAFEAATLQGLKKDRASWEVEEDGRARKWVAHLFGVTDPEVLEIECGFDHFFSWQQAQAETCQCDGCRAARQYPSEEQALADKSEMFQVGWHVAKRATKHYMELDAAEDEAWALHKRLGLGQKSWLDIRHERFMARWGKDKAHQTDLQKFLDECVGEDCPDPSELMPLA